MAQSNNASGTHYSLDSISAIQTRDWLTIVNTSQFTLSLGEYRISLSAATEVGNNGYDLDVHLYSGVAEQAIQGLPMAGFNEYAFSVSVSDAAVLHNLSVYALLQSSRTYVASQIQIEKLT